MSVCVDLVSVCDRVEISYVCVVNIRSLGPPSLSVALSLSSVLQILPAQTLTLTSNELISKARAN